MIESPGIVLTVASFAFVIGLLVFIHEFGHYIAGRMFGVKADVFSIGFGRELIGWTDRRGTRWKVAAVPLGGYVKFAGDMNAASRQDEDWKNLPSEQRDQTFPAKPLWQRAVIVAAGPSINLAFSVLIFSAFFTLYGQQHTPPLVASVTPASAAERAGLLSGDFVVSVRGQRIDRFEDIKRIIMIRPSETLEIVVLRDNVPKRILATPKLDEQVDRFGNHYRQGLLGIAPVAPVIRPLTPLRAVEAAIVHSYELIGMIIDTTGQVITGRRSVEELGGPLKIAQFSGQQAAMGWPDLIEFMALISINLGFINLLPVPMLDGGHLLFYGIEAIRRRPVGQRTQEWAFRSGLALITTLMLLVTMNDLGSLGLWTGLARLIS